MPSIYTQAEVEQHNVKGDLWMTIHEKVYDVSTFAEDVSFFDELAVEILIWHVDILLLASRW